MPRPHLERGTLDSATSLPRGLIDDATATLELALVETRAQPIGQWKVVDPEGARTYTI